ncbi:MAG: glycosyltransferase family 4 protein [Betaproteobacteria bacterium]|nr:glycosyltransferase family 4 protein [Betaproteobacteria bacterium]
MRILVTASHAPFLQGGGERHVDNLCVALRAAGHEVELVRLPFKFRPEADIERLMAYCDGFDLSAPNGQHVDRLISLQFPGYGMRHPQHVVWLMHQHRAVYELFDPREATPELRELREQILAYDRRALSGVARIFANSRRVAERLRQYNGLESTPLYHPPPDAESLRCEESWGYVFCPSRLESLKRQDLLIEAARLTTGDAKILIGGEGPQRERYERLIERHGLGDKVRMIGAFTEAERIALYAHALAVVFPAFDEDLGYVPLEAMYAGKPVVTCSDSGGALEFVAPGETGEVVEPSPAALAAAIDGLAARPDRAREMGAAGRERIVALGLSWQRVVATLCA